MFRLPAWKGKIPDECIKIGYEMYHEAEQLPADGLPYPVVTLALGSEPPDAAKGVVELAKAALGAEMGSFFPANPQGEFAGFPLPEHSVRLTNVAPNPDSRVRSCVGAAVIAPSGERLGSLFLGHSSPAWFEEPQEKLARQFAAQVALAIDHARVREEAEWSQGELKRASSDLRRAKTDLETFAYSASHDLQEPVRNVALNAQLLEMYAGDAIPAANKPFLEGILTGVRHMESVVRDLLSYTQAIRHRDGSVPVVSAQSVLAGVVESLREQIADCGAEIHFDHLPDVAIHEFHLSQLFQNLIGNALKYRGSEVPRVEISAHCVDGWTVFSVSDNGIGIEPKYAEQIFVLFKRLHTRAEFPGSGIGLSICQRVVEQYGGRIWLEHSVPGQGSAFSFSVPDRRP